MMKNKPKLYELSYWDGPSPRDMSQGYWNRIKLWISDEVLDALCNGVPFISVKTIDGREAILNSSNIGMVIEIKENK